jgi:hypothetical protein
MRVSLLFAFLGVGSCLAAGPGVPGSDPVLTATSVYSKEPSCPNAASLMALIPDRTLARQERPSRAANDALYGLLTLLQARLLHGDACAARLAFRLRRVSDAAFAEDLSEALGALATTRPLLFLQEVQRSGQGCSVVTSFDSDYSPSEERAERALRLSQLQRPVPASLSAVRSECLHLLRAAP